MASDPCNCHNCRKSLSTAEQAERVSEWNRVRRREQNESAERRQKTYEFAMQRCVNETGISDNDINHQIAMALVKAERHDVRDVNNVHIFRNELDRLRELARKGPNFAATEEKLLECEHNICTYREELTRGRRARTEELSKLINTCRVEFIRAAGNALAENVIAKRLFTVPWGEGHLAAGQPNDYYTIHSPEYEHGATHPDLAHRFRGITLRTKRLTIRSVMLRDVVPYRDMLRNPLEFPHGRFQPELDEKTVRSRFHISGVEADRGGSYKFAITDGNPGEFIGIASLNCFADIDPNTFFRSNIFDNQSRRMVDFSFQFLSRRWHRDLATEVVSALIEFARIRLGCELFRSECSPFDAQYSASMEAVGLAKFRSIEPLSYNPALAAATWKFDFNTWESVKDILIFRNRFFMGPAFVQSPRNVVPDRPPLPIPELAIVKMPPSLPGEPIPYYISEDQLPAALHSPDPMEELEFGAATEESSDPLTAIAVAVAATKVLSEAGSGLGFSDSSNGSSSIARSDGFTGTSASSSSATPDSMEVDVWLGYDVAKVQWQREASRLMPPPPRPNLQAGISPQPSSSKFNSASVQNFSGQSVSAAQSIPLAAALHDPKGKRRADLPQQSHVAEGTPSAPVPYDRKGKGRALLPVEDSDIDMTTQTPAIYDRKGKRPAAVSWESQPKKPSPLHQISTPNQAESSNPHSSTRAVAQLANPSSQFGAGMSYRSLPPRISAATPPDLGLASPNTSLTMHHASQRGLFPPSPASSHNDSTCWSPPQSPLVTPIGRSLSLIDTSPSSSSCSPTEQRSPSMQDVRTSTSSSWARACDKLLPPARNADLAIVEPTLQSAQGKGKSPATTSSPLPVFGAKQSTWNKYANLVVEKANQLMQPGVAGQSNVQVTPPAPQHLSSTNKPRQRSLLESEGSVQSKSDAYISPHKLEATKLRNEEASVQHASHTPSPQAAPNGVQEPGPSNQKHTASGQNPGSSTDPSLNEEDEDGFQNLTIYNCKALLRKERNKIAEYERQLEAAQEAMRQTAPQMAMQMAVQTAPQLDEPGSSSQSRPQNATLSTTESRTSHAQNEQSVSAGSAVDTGVGPANQSSINSLPLAIRERQQTSGKKSATGAQTRKNTRKSRQGQQSPQQTRQGRRGSVKSRAPLQKLAPSGAAPQSGNVAAPAGQSTNGMATATVLSAASSSRPIDPRQGVAMPAPVLMSHRPSVAAAPPFPPAASNAYSASPVQTSVQYPVQPSVQSVQHPMQPSVQSVHHPMQPSAQTSVQYPMQTSAQPSVQSSVQSSVQYPVQNSAQPSAQTSVQFPMQTSAQPPVQSSVQSSAQPSVQSSVQYTVQYTVQNSAQPSAQTSVQFPVQTSVQYSAQPSAQTSVQSPMQTSAQPSAQTSLQYPMQASAQSSVQSSVQYPVQTSAQPSVQPSVQYSAQPSIQYSAQSSAPSSVTTKERRRLPQSGPADNSQANIVDLTQNPPYAPAIATPARQLRFVHVQPGRSVLPTQIMPLAAPQVQQVFTTNASSQSNAATRQVASPRSSTSGEERPEWSALLRASTEREAARQVALQQALHAQQAVAMQWESAAGQASSHSPPAPQHNDNHWNTAPDPPLSWQTAPWARSAAQALSQRVEAPQPVRPNSVVLLQTSEQEVVREEADGEEASPAKRRPWQL